MTSPDVLVTGSAGHLGCAAMLDLPSHGYTPIGIDILVSDTTTEVGSITDRAFVDSVLARHPSIRYVVHAATLHKPHVASHAKADFVDVNIHGTLTLLEAAAALGPERRLDAFVFVSTTSAFGRALSPAAGRPAAWIDEDVAAVPKNIYGVTKTAAEDLCRLAHAQTGLPTVILRTARFFPEPDDDDARRAALPDANLKMLELAYRRVDVADAVAACACALARARAIGWGRYIISAPPPFARDDAETLRRLGAGDAATACADAVPGLADVVRREPGWGLLPRLDRVYDPARAQRDLGWRPRFTIHRAVDCVLRGEEWRSELALRVGTKGYHAVSTGVYTVR